MRFDRKLYMGIVEDNKDPKKKGRIKVRVQSIFNVIPTEDIPWASPFMDLAGKEYKIPAIGKIVNVLFLTNNMYDPYYIYSQNYNINLENKLNSLSDDEYVDFVAMLFDERTQIYSDSKELTIDHLYNKITINNDSINHELKDNTQKLNLGSKNANQDAVLGNHWFDWFDKFVNTLLQPTSMLGNMSAPIVKPQVDALLQEYLTIKKTFRSNNVKIVDNNQVSKLKRNPETDTTKNDKNLIDNTFVTETFENFNNTNNTDNNDYLYRKDPQNEKKLQDKIVDQNIKSDDIEENSKPSSKLSEPETEFFDNEDYVKDDIQVIIDDIIHYVKSDDDIEKLENDSKNKKKLFTTSGNYKGQSYSINDENNIEKDKIYDINNIEEQEIEIPKEAGKYDIFLNGENIGKKGGVKFKGKIVIVDYYPPIKKMFDAAKSEGIDLILQKSYVSYEEQYNYRISNAPPEKKANETFLKNGNPKDFNPQTSKPGYSIHNYGTAFDISTNGGKNDAYKWLEKNAIYFGLIRTIKSATWHWVYSPWNINKNIRPWDKYSFVPKGHETWSKDED